MACAYCGARMTWPDDFPSPWLAECEACAKRRVVVGWVADQVATVFLAFMVVLFLGSALLTLLVE